jgi:hypothetical protein
MNGFVQLELPPAFDFYSDFTLSGWVFSGNLPNHATAIALECAQVHEPVLQVGEWHQTKILRACYHPPHKQDNSENRWLSISHKYKFGRWYHVAAIRVHDRLSFYFDGTLQDSKQIPLSKISLTRVCFFSLRLYA